jgi:hypothetical protein
LVGQDKRQVAAQGMRLFDATRQSCRPPIAYSVWLF